MLYLGVKLYKNSFKITALTEGFAHLGAKYFGIEENNYARQWINSIKNKSNEACSWFFDEFNYTENSKDSFKFCYDNENDYIYLINHRKLQNIIQFIYEFALKTEEPIMFDIDSTFILASAVRLFSFEEIISCKEFYAF